MPSSRRRSPRLTSEKTWVWRAHGHPKLGPWLAPSFDLYACGLATWDGMKRSALLAVVLAQACSAQNGVTGTVDPGDNFVAPDLTLDESFFFCRIEPDVLQKHSCAGGGAGEQGMCHDSRSALRLRVNTDPPPCDASGHVTGRVPDSYRADLEAVQYFVQSDPLTSPLYLRPTNQTSHPRRIFDESDAAAKLITEWISAGAR